MEYSSSAALLQYLHGEGKVPTVQLLYITVGDGHFIVKNNNNNEDDDDDASCYEKLSSYT